MKDKTIRIFNYPWHIAHQYELMKLPNTKWSWLAQHRRKYSPFPRGDFFTEFGAEWVPHYESGKYDVALLHLDQQCFEDSLWERGKGSLFKDVSKVIGNDIPKVVIMHGTPYYPEAFKSDITKENHAELGMMKNQIGMSSELIKRFHEAVKDFDAIVLNSKVAKKQWGMERDPRAVTIWHGLDADEWYDLPKEPRVVTMISPAGLDRYYDRTFMRGIKEILIDKDIHHCHITIDAQFKNWDEYKEFLGRSLIYLNPTKESPMPRARTEAMLSGCCVLTTPHQDADEFIKTGENGIIIPRNPQFVADLIESLIYDYKKAIELGQKGKQTAKEIFNVEQFQKAWADIFNKIIK